MVSFSPGTAEGRRKGGLISQRNRKRNPEYYRGLGCIVANRFTFPRKSNLLAEFVGIVLGDGGLTNGQLHITLNSVADVNYLDYVIKLSERLFNYSPHMYKKKGALANVLVFSGVELINFLLRMGLKLGNKVKIQVDSPDWIKLNKSYSLWCLRGLMDTDGGVFKHKYMVNNKEYSYLKICFTNMSQPLIRFVFNTLSSVGLGPKYRMNNKVWLYNSLDVVRYFSIVGSSNERLFGMLG